MTKVQAAKYNRLSTKCHHWVKENHPEIYEMLRLYVEADWRDKKYRRVSHSNLKLVEGQTPMEKAPILSNQESIDDWQQFDQF